MHGNFCLDHFKSTLCVDYWFIFSQGPFRTPEEVQKQRYKGLQPTLRVATSYTSVEEAREAMKAKEWIMRVNDNM